MKRIFLTLLLCLPLAAAAETLSLRSFYDRYAGCDGYRTLLLGRRMMQMAARNASDESLHRLMDGIDEIFMVTAPASDEGFERSARSLTDGFELLSRIDEEGQSTSFFLREPDSGDGPIEFLMLSSDGCERVVLCVRGRFDVRQIARLSALLPSFGQP